MTEFSYAKAFNVCYEWCGDHDCDRYANQPFTVVRAITEPTPEIDADALPMFLVQCAGDTFHAWPEEVLADRIERDNATIAKLIAKSAS
jgi:hypothetical protein